MTARYRAILFDADGTLIDSVEAHVLSFRELAEEVGLGPVDVRKYIGLSFRNIIRNAFGEKWLDKLDELRERRKDIFLRKYFEKVTPLIPLSTLRELRKRYKLGVVTSGGILTLSLLKKIWLYGAHGRHYYTKGKEQAMPRSHPQGGGGGWKAYPLCGRYGL